MIFFELGIGSKNVFVLMSVLVKRKKIFKVFFLALKISKMAENWAYFEVRTRKSRVIFHILKNDFEIEYPGLCLSKIFIYKIFIKKL